MPLGLPKNNQPAPAPVQRAQQPPAPIKDYNLPSPPPSQQWEQPQVHVQTTEPAMVQPQDDQTQSLPQPLQVQYQHPELVQSPALGQHTPAPNYFQAEARQDIPEVYINQV